MVSTPMILPIVQALIPAGFILLILQGLSEIIKRVAFLLGLIPDPTEKVVDPYVEEVRAAQDKPT